ncbi:MULTISPECIES: AAA family ATPase [Arsenicicoccus]|uniref:AAA family ATPase n=1 Tax=Arsenicicoccus TaxID=267408 RepID=UPI00257F93E9|nr:MULTISPECIES: AAA family ATPase [Arsenicicoccus]
MSGSGPGGLRASIDALVEAGRAAGLDAERVRDEGLALSAAVLQTSRPGSTVHTSWATELGRWGSEFFEHAPRGRRFASSPSTLLTGLLADGSSHAAAYASALAEVATAACTLPGADSGAVGRATTSAGAQLAAAGAPGSAVGAAPPGRMPDAPTPPGVAGSPRASASPPSSSSDSVREQLRALEAATLQALRGLRPPSVGDAPHPAPPTPPGIPAGPPPSGPGAPGIPEQPSAPRAAPTTPSEPAEPVAPPEPEKSVDELLAELDALVGLARVKREVHRQVALLQMEAKREKAGLRSATLTRHLVFTGNPGTGKTTVARLVGGIYRALGLLSKGQLVEVDRSELVAGYLGQTATKTSEVVGSALGGVLFIDEAYALNGDQYGKEAIDTLVKEMEDHRADLVVIVAGYPEPMSEFIRTNPGLQSRFNTVIEFEDYTDDELVGIIEDLSAKNDYDLSEGAITRFREILAATPRGESFGNGRFARNTLEGAIGRHAWRLREEDDPSVEQLRTIEAEDLDEREGVDLTV